MVWFKAYIPQIIYHTQIFRFFAPLLNAVLMTTFHKLYFRGFFCLHWWISWNFKNRHFSQQNFSILDQLYFRLCKKSYLKNFCCNIWGTILINYLFSAIWILYMMYNLPFLNCLSIILFNTLFMRNRKQDREI